MNSQTHRHIHRRKSFYLVAALCLVVGAPSHAATKKGAASKDGPSPFEEIIRKTEPLTPEQEQKMFHLPPGFEIELVAAEPQIAKPINMAFDGRGRLWVNVSREYPIPAPVDKGGRDTIRILEDINGDGRADKVTVFADSLNIPIGLTPYKDGAIVYSIPNIWRLHDTHASGTADRREALFGPLGYERDTHGMNASFRRGFDGWIYATHGFNNESNYKARDGSHIKLVSGNTLRFRPDGSRVEQYTWGQVNPFGACFDPLGNYYTADCHSSPIYQLLRGGYYPSFGKPNDGLGFAPTMMQHNHGSTAIAGIVFYAEGNWPAEYRTNMLVGNVMTCKINRDRIVFDGSSPKAVELPDFLTCDDPWFRPVDLQFGPDGALYVADFYNRIIGHYEVALTHSGRDRERGRIWRIVYRGGTPSLAQKPARPMNLGAETPAQLVAELANPNFTRRMLAMNELSDRVGAAAAASVRRMLGQKSATLSQRIHGLWVLYRIGALEPSMVARAAKDPEPGVRMQAMRLLAETPAWSGERQWVLAGLHDPDARVQRAAADALGLHPDPVQVDPLLEACATAPASDTHLIYTLRMALRNQFLPEGALAAFAKREISENIARTVADVAVAIPTPEAGDFLLRHLLRYGEERENLVRYLRHAARYVQPSRMDELVNIIRGKVIGDIELQLSFFKSIQDGTAQRGATLSAAARRWGGELAADLLDPRQSDSNAWINTPIEGKGVTTNPWVVQKRNSGDSDVAESFLSSLPVGGEQFTGVLRSPVFEIPEKLSFFLAGHDGPRSNPLQKKNFVRLRSAEGGELLMETSPPRNDVARKFDWDLGKHRGRRGYIEIVDGDDGRAFAWLAAGRFDPPVVTVPALGPNQVSQRQQSGAELARSLALVSLEPALSGLLASEHADLDARAAAARALVALKSNDSLAGMAPLIGDAAVPMDLRRRLAFSLAGAESGKARATLVEGLKSAPYRGQLKLALALAANRSGAEVLLERVEQGQASRRLLQDKSLRETILASNPGEARTRIENLTRDLSPESEELRKLMELRRSEYSPDVASPVKGAYVFIRYCNVCHQIDGNGALVGPQLDGVGSRGLERLLEDVLDPNRNVDQAFRSHIIKLKDGEVLSGLPRREEGEVLVIAESTGKEISIPKKDIAERRESESSLMPNNFGEVLQPDEVRDLMGFLLSKSGKPPEKKDK